MIPEPQLETWSHQGALVTSIATHESVRNALDASTSLVRSNRKEVYLQGSYKNDTNIRGDSDVDLVVQCNEVFFYNLSSLQINEKNLFEQTLSNATYQWQDFKPDVLAALRNYYGSSMVSEGNKSLKVAAGSNRLPADVVVGFQYRKYKRFLGTLDNQYFEGIQFYATRDARWIVNYPKLHCTNGANKNSQTNGSFKPTVRVFKNARTRLVENGIISNNLAPSYFLECLIYNVPNDKFVNSFQSTFVNAVNWLADADFSDFVCQNLQLPLFGSTQEQWSITDAKTLVEKLADLWNNWR